MIVIGCYWLFTDEESVSKLSSAEIISTAKKWRYYGKTSIF